MFYDALCDMDTRSHAAAVGSNFPTAVTACDSIFFKFLSFSHASGRSFYFLFKISSVFQVSSTFFSANCLDYSGATMTNVLALLHSTCSLHGLVRFCLTIILSFYHPFI